MTNRQAKRIAAAIGMSHGYSAAAQGVKASQYPTVADIRADAHGLGLSLTNDPRNPASKDVAAQAFQHGWKQGHAEYQEDNT